MREFESANRSVIQSAGEYVSGQEDLQREFFEQLLGDLRTVSPDLQLVRLRTMYRQTRWITEPVEDWIAGLADRMQLLAFAADDVDAIRHLARNHDTQLQSL